MSGGDEGPSIVWPCSRPWQKSSRLDGNYLPHVAATVKHNLTLFPDIVKALTVTWSNPHSAKLMLHGCAPFMDLWGMEGAWLVHMPPVDRKLASYLAPLANKGMANANPTLPNKHCRFSAAQLDKVYHAEGVAAQSLSSVTMLEVHTHTQARLWPQESSAQSSWMRSLLQPTSFCACPGTPFWRSGRAWELLWWESVVFGWRFRRGRKGTDRCTSTSRFLPQGCLVQLWRQCRPGSRPKRNTLVAHFCQGATLAGFNH